MPHRHADSVVKLGAITLALILGTAGLAVGGVNLPEGAQQAFERAGISLPNQAGGEGGQAGDNARSDEVRSVIDATPTGERGCEFGHRVAEAAKGSALPEQARTACEHGQDNATPNGNSHRGSTRASEQSASDGREFGQETAARARGLGEATAEQRRQFGEDTAQGAKELGSDHPTGPPTNVSSPPAQSLAGPPATEPAAPDHPTGPPAGTPGGRP
jgi:hypothetical protein